MNGLKKLPSLKLDRTRQSAPQVFEALREAIIAVQLEPGTVLQRAELAEHFGISQTPIRDALIRLGEEQLVDIFPQHATVVSRIDLSAALEAHFLRRAIEIEILKTLCALPQPEHGELIKRLKFHLEVQETTLKPLNVQRLASADQAFHKVMYDAAQVSSLWSLIQKRSGHVERLRHLNLPAKGKAQAILQDHRNMVLALEKKDVLAAETVLRQHLAGTLSFVKDMKKRFPDWVA